MIIIGLVNIIVLGFFPVFILSILFKYKYSYLEMSGLSFFYGLWLVVLGLFYCFVLAPNQVNVFALKPYIVAATLLLSILALFVIRVYGREFIRKPEPEKKLGLFEKFLLLGIILQVLWVIFLVFPVPVHSHDAVANYALKAKIFYFSDGIPSGFFRWPEATVSHPDYPLMVPLVMSWIYAFTGFNDININLIMPALYTFFIILFFSLSRKWFDRKYSFLTVFILATVPQLYSYATIIHSDLFLTAFISFAFIYFVNYLRDNDTASLFIASSLFGVSLWIKNEAVVFAASFILSLFVYTFRSRETDVRKKLIHILCSICIISLIWMPWLLIKIKYASANSDINISNLTVSRVIENIRDIPILLNLFQQEVFGPKKWNIFWVIFFACIIWKRKDIKKDINYIPGFFILVSMFGYFSGYMITTGNNLFFYVNTTISRFMLHFTGICSFFMARLAYNDVNMFLNNLKKTGSV